MGGLSVEVDFHLHIAVSVVQDAHDGAKVAVDRVIRVFALNYAVAGAKHLITDFAGGLCCVIWIDFIADDVVQHILAKIAGGCSTVEMRWSKDDGSLDAELSHTVQILPDDGLDYRVSLLPQIVALAVREQKLFAKPQVADILAESPILTDFNCGVRNSGIRALSIVAVQRPCFTST